MSLTDMYPAKNNSPVTTLADGINSSDTTMTVEDASVLPAAPNIAVIGSGDSAEIVKYTAVSTNTLTIVRGQNGTTPGVWAAGAPVARNITALDHEAFRANILDLDTRKTDSGHTHDDRYYTETEMNTSLALKAPLSTPALTGTPTAPTASASTNTTQLATCEYVHKRGLYTCSGSIPAGSTKTFSNAAIKATMKIPGDYARFSDPSKVTSAVNYTVADGSITFTGTFTGAVTIYFDLMEFDTISLT